MAFDADSCDGPDGGAAFGEVEGVEALLGRGADVVEVACEVLRADLDAPLLPRTDRVPGVPQGATDRGARDSRPKPQLLKVRSDVQGGSCSVSGHTVACSVTRHKPKCAAVRYVAGMTDILIEQLRDRRESLGLTLRGIAPEVGIAFNTLAAYEAGRVDPPFSRVRKLAAALGLRLQVLAVPDDGAPELTDADLTPAQRQVLKALLRALPTLDDQRAQVIAGVLDLAHERSKTPGA